jgi:hypothetical protein
VLVHDDGLNYPSNIGVAMLLEEQAAGRDGPAVNSGVDDIPFA